MRVTMDMNKLSWTIVCIIYIAVEFILDLAKDAFPYGWLNISIRTAIHAGPLILWFILDRVAFIKKNTNIM